MMILENAAVIALVVLFIQATTWPNMIFARVGDALEDHLPNWLYMPLIGCPICMSPWWGTAILWISRECGFNLIAPHEGWRTVIQCILTIFAAGGMSVFSVMAIKKYHLHSEMLDELEDPGND